MAVLKQDDQHEHTFSSYVRIRDVVTKTYLGWWTIGRSGERGSGISVLPARHNDDDDDSVVVIEKEAFWSHLIKVTNFTSFNTFEHFSFRSSYQIVLILDSLYFETYLL